MAAASSSLSSVYLLTSASTSKHTSLSRGTCPIIVLLIPCTFIPLCGHITLGEGVAKKGGSCKAVNQQTRQMGHVQKSCLTTAANVARFMKVNSCSTRVFSARFFCRDGDTRRGSAKVRERGRCKSGGRREELPNPSDVCFTLAC